MFSGSDGQRPLVGWPKAHRRLLREICALTGERVAVRLGHRMICDAPSPPTSQRISVWAASS